MYARSCARFSGRNLSATCGPEVLSLIDDPHARAAQLAEHAVMGNGALDHAWRIADSKDAAAAASTHRDAREFGHQAATTLIRAAFRERGFRRITISTS
jgi:hypothetical protein